MLVATAKFNMQAFSGKGSIVPFKFIELFKGTLPSRLIFVCYKVGMLKLISRRFSLMWREIDDASSVH